MRLVCLPPAGGSAAFFSRWPRLLPDPFRLQAVDYPGHGRRIGEPVLRTLPGLAGAVAEALHLLPGDPWLLYGHSMGALVGFELAHTLPPEVTPGLLAVSGLVSPDVFGIRDPLHTLREEALVDRARRWSPALRQALDVPELRELLLPGLRVDLEAMEAWKWSPRPPLECPILAVAGRSDPMLTGEGMQGWQRMTLGQFRLEHIDGDHDLPSADPGRLIELILAAATRSG